MDKIVWTNKSKDSSNDNAQNTNEVRHTLEFKLEIEAAAGDCDPQRCTSFASRDQPTNEKNRLKNIFEPPRTSFVSMRISFLRRTMGAWKPLVRPNP
jgi:hypothetical protein